ncbi:MAG: oligosaccharide flippase family protein [Chloracidobacterium sp.]|nr:oligosaccharide flippase family protein [Chloracidobacterium sp.]
MGLQKQVLLSVINGICATLRSVGALIVLIFISQTIQAFLLWQTFVIVLQLLLLMSTMGRSLPDGMPGQFKWDIFSKIWRFAAGVSGISVLSLILNQTDKLILSRMVDLEHFGYYMLAVTIASTSIVMFVGPLSHAVYPEFARLISAKNENALTEFYHRSCETVSAIVFPVTAVIVFFSYEILFVWTGNREIATNTFLILTLIALGSGLNASMWPLHFLQLAHGWTSLVFKVGIALVVFVTPAIVFGVYTYGAIGGAAGWAILTAIFIPIMVHMMHRRILRGEKTRWYLKDFFAPLIVAGGVAGTMRLFLPMAETRLEVLIELFAVSTITLVVTVLATTATRNFVEAYWRKARQGRK